jgi:hypothetical protein
MNLFEIAIQRKFEDTWPIVIKFRSKDGLTTHAEGRLRLSGDDFERLIEYQDDAEAYGTLLGKQLFQDGEVRDAFARARGQSPNYLRFLLSLEVSPQDTLRTLHWERLCFPEAGEWHHVALDPRLPFSLYVPTSIDRRFSLIGRRDLRALVLVVSPENSAQWNLAPFDVQTTVAGVQKALGEIPCDILAHGAEGAIGLPTLDNLCEQLINAEKPYTLLHIVCHGRVKSGGDRDTILYWANADNQVDTKSSNGCRR